MSSGVALVSMRSSHQRCALALPNAAALTASTIVRELVSRNAVMMVAFMMLWEWNGVGQLGVEMRP